MSDVKWDVIQPLEVSQEAIEQSILLLQKAGWMQEHDRLLTEGKWIPCTERLPEDKQRCLVTVWVKDGKYSYVQTSCFNAKWGWWSDIDFTDSYKALYVIAWMPLPQPHKGE